MSEVKDKLVNCSHRKWQHSARSPCPTQESSQEGEYSLVTTWSVCVCGYWIDDAGSVVYVESPGERFVEAGVGGRHENGKRNAVD